MTTVHRNLTGADLHEPKGADTALAGRVYVSDGAGSGSWTDASSIITNTAFTTGDTKITLKTTADSGWIMGAAGSIGDGSSSATIRANADTSALFTLLWTNFSDSLAPVSGGRGASAALDFAAHKRITLPDIWGRAIGVVGAGTGLTSRTLGQLVGSETSTLTLSQLPTGITATTSGVVTVNMGGNVPRTAGAISSQPSPTTGGNYVPWSNAGAGDWVAITTASTSGAVTVTSNNTSGSSHSIMSPYVFLNLMIKL